MPIPYKYNDLWEWYYDYTNFPISAEVKKAIGGAVNADWIANTCAIRMSMPFNYNGAPVPGNFEGLSTVKGGDGKRYAFRIRELRKWLRYKLGKPDFDLEKQAGTAFDKATLSSKKGIIAFDITFADSTGHIDMWDGTVFSSEHKGTNGSYWADAKRITLWQTTG